MNGLIEAALRIGAARVRRVADALFARASADLPPGVRAERTDEGVALTGRGLRARSLNDARLRRIGR